MDVLLPCLGVYVPLATLVVVLLWVFLFKGPLAFTTTLYWVAASALGTSFLLWPIFAEGSAPRVGKKVALFVVVGLILLAGIILFVSYGINDL